MFHKMVYRVGAVALSLVMLGLTVYVVAFAMGRKSGSTGVDAQQIMNMRYKAQQEMLAERGQ